MPPRRNTRSVAAAERATTALSPLPLSIVLYIFSLLPVDCRLRCAEVCRGWRAVLLERSLWTRLDLSATSGVHVPEEGAAHGALDSLFRCAAARAGGGLQALHVGTDRVTFAALREVVAANGGALRELHPHFREGDFGIVTPQVEALCGAAPLLQVLATHLYCHGADVEAVRGLLRNEAPFGPMRVRRLTAHLGGVDEAGVVAFAADLAGHASLNGMQLHFAPLHMPAALDAVVDAALARRIQSLTMHDCYLSPASAPALARLLGGDALTTLECRFMRMLDAPAAHVLAAALRANATLTSLKLTEGAGVFADPTVADELLGALTGHASLRKLNICENSAVGADRAAVGAALGALVAANAPALTELAVSDCALGDDGLRPLFEALPRNAHMRKLDCAFNYISEAFARDVLLPAVRTNVSLLELHADDERSAVEASALVARRAAAVE
jgi:hypothetical protein